MARHLRYRFLPVQVGTVFYRPLDAFAGLTEQEGNIKLRGSVLPAFCRKG